VSVVILAAGVAVWLWTVVLIPRKVPRGELITTDPYTVVRQPLCTGAAFLVLPWAGFLPDTGLGALLGVVLYVASRVLAGEERPSWPGPSATAGTVTPRR